MFPANAIFSRPAWRDRLLVRYRARGWRGFTRLYNLLKPVATRPHVEMSTRYGSRFLLAPGDEVDSHVMREGFYESEVLEALRPALAEPDAVLWVVGANFGLHAITAKFLYPAAKVLAFEPAPAMAARVLENATLNRLDIELHNYALAGAPGILPFHANSAGNPGMSTLHPCAGFSYEHRFFVVAQSPALVIERGDARPPTALLVDAEGAEEEILRGFGTHLAAPGLRRLVFETANDFLESKEPAGLHRLVTQAGFAIEKLERRENTAHALSNFLARRP